MIFYGKWGGGGRWGRGGGVKKKNSKDREGPKNVWGRGIFRWVGSGIVNKTFMDSPI